MILYHGSRLEISRPALIYSRPNLNFGTGFYTTPIYEQAVNWCSKFKRRGKNGIISCFEFDETAFSRLKLLKFDSYSEEWLDFILSCRSGNDKTEAISRLRYEKPNLQICLRSQEAIDKYLHFEGSKQG